MNLKIREHYLDQKNGESKIYLDLDGKLSIVYVTNHGLQILHLENPELTPEQVHIIFKFVEDYLGTIAEEPISENKAQLINEESKQSAASGQSETSNGDGEVPLPNTSQNPQSDSQTEGCGESEGVGSGLGQET